MQDNGIRIGIVSSYNADNGTASIYYPDRCHEVTNELPIVCPFGIIQPLKKEDKVLVLHLSNGKGAGVVIGGYQAEDKVGISEAGGDLIFKDASGSITLREIIQKCREEG